MYPRSGFCSGGTSECTLVPVFVPGEHPPKPPFCQVQKKHAKKFQHKEFWGSQDPPPLEILYVGLFPVFLIESDKRPQA